MMWRTMMGQGRYVPPILAFVLLCLFCSGVFLQLCHPAQAGHKTPSSVRLSGKLEYFQAACQSLGIQLSQTSVPTTINSVRLGTPAFYAGLRAGDRIVDGNVEADVLTLRVERQDLKFTVNLPVNMRAMRALLHSQHLVSAVSRDQGAANVTTASVGINNREQAARKAGGGTNEQEQVSTGNQLAAQLQPGTAIKDTNETLPATADTASIDTGVETLQLAGAVSDTQLLRQHHIILVVDRSGSMATKDRTCEGLSRFEWCREAIGGLSTAPEFADKRFTLVFFNNYVDVIRDCDARVVERMFTLTEPDGGTDLSAAIDEALRLSSQHPDRPTVIAVLHDGMPNRGADIDTVLINATHRLPNAQQLAITFLQIGQDRRGSELLHYLDTGLVARGAKFDIVDTVSFEVLKDIGLKGALIAAIKEARTSTSQLAEHH